MNRKRPILILVAACLAALSAADSWADVLDFEAPAFPLATTYGNPVGHSPGDLAFTHWDIDFTVENFTLGGFTGFNYARIAGHPGPPMSFFPAAVNNTQVLQINNINLQADFAAVPFDVTAIKLDYVDLGGDENIDINGIGRREPARLSDIAGAAAFPGFTVNVTEIPISGGVHGALEVVADPGESIKTFTIGGQEFAIDNFLKIPEPTAAALLGLQLVGVVSRRGLRRS